MKHLLTAIACCLAVAGSAQTPYNPDSNGDNFIGSHDLLDFLPLYDSPFISTDSITVQTVDSATYLIDTCFHNPVPTINFTYESNCTGWDSLSQVVFEPLDDGSGWGYCYVYHWFCWDSVFSYQLPVEIEESTDWVNLQDVNTLDLPADSSFKMLYIAVDSRQYNLILFSEGEFIGTAGGGSTSATGLRRLAIFTRDVQGTWYYNK